MITPEKHWCLIYKLHHDIIWQVQPIGGVVAEVQVFYAAGV